MRHLRLSLLFVAGISLLPAELSAEDRALLVGIGKYIDAHRNLPGIEKDLNATSTALISNLGFKQNQLRVLKDEQATEQAIRREIQGWLSGAGPNDRAVFYYSGHGSLAKDGAGVVGILVPYDTTAKNGTLIHALPGPDLGSMFARLSSRHLLVVIDACHSGHLTDNTRSVGVVDKFFSYEGMPTGEGELTFLRPPGVAKGIARDETENYVLLSACRRNESAAATANGSVLTQTMADSFRQMQSSRKPVTIGAAHSQITQALASSSFRDKQHPEVSGTQALNDYNWATRGIAPDPVPQPTPPPPPPQPRPQVQTPVKPPVQKPPTPAPARPQPPRPQPAPAIVPDPTPTQPVSQDWDLLRSLYDKRGSELNITIGTTAYRRGEEMILQVQVPSEGYLNVISIGKGDASATVLFPNEFAADNRVTPGIVSLPGKFNFKLEQELPAGVARQENQLLVVFTEKPMNLFADGEGKGTFRSLGTRTRSTVVKSRDGGPFAAGYVTYVIGQQ